ncbi:MAG: hypothetical protein J0L69_12890 [Bacteroidetes bacterium]|nr:hypothetical protein [Bacteroidota bacterium]
MAKTARPRKDFDTSSLKVGDILWYKNIETASSKNPNHPHIIVAIEDDWFYTVGGTSQQETIERKIKHNGHDHSMFPAFEKPEHGLRNTTFFDCTQNFEINGRVLKKKYQKGELVKKAGSLTVGEYEQLRLALRKNASCDISDILIHPDDEVDGYEEAAEE